MVRLRIPKHPRFNEILWVVGYVDAYGAVHAKILFNGEKNYMHGDVFPGVQIFNPWRWGRSQGLMPGLQRPDAGVLNDEDVEKVRDWLYKNGCLNDWEL